MLRYYVDELYLKARNNLIKSLGSEDPNKLSSALGDFEPLVKKTKNGPNESELLSLAKCEIDRLKNPNGINRS